MWKIDFHNHTKEDRMDKIKHSAVELVQKANDLKFSAIAITLHNYQEALEEAVALGKELNVLVIPSIELTIEGKHILAIGLSQKVANSIHSIEELRQAKKQYTDTCLIIAPHPFYIIGHSLNKKFHQWKDIFDTVEISRITSPLVSRFNKKAGVEAAKIGLPTIANSDSHSLKDFGTVYSLIQGGEKTPTKETIFAAIRNRRISPVCPPITNFKLISSTWKNIISEITRISLGRKDKHMTPKAQNAG